MLLAGSAWVSSWRDVTGCGGAQLWPAHGRMFVKCCSQQTVCSWSRHASHAQPVAPSCAFSHTRRPNPNVQQNPGDRPVEKYGGSMMMVSEQHAMNEHESQMRGGVAESPAGDRAQGETACRHGSVTRCVSSHDFLPRKIHLRLRAACVLEQLMCHLIHEQGAKHRGYAL